MKYIKNIKSVLTSNLVSPVNRLNVPNSKIKVPAPAAQLSVSFFSAPYFKLT